MATLAETLIAGAQDNIARTTPDMQSSVNAGIELAMKKEALDQQREATASKLKELEVTKYERVGKAIEAGSNLKDGGAQTAYFNSYLPKLNAAMGNILPEDTMQLLTKSPEFRQKFMALKSQVQRGELSFEEAVTQLSPEQLAQVDDSLLEAEKFAQSEEGKGMRAMTMAAGQESRFSRAQGRQSDQFKKGQLAQQKSKFDSLVAEDRKKLTAADNALQLLNIDKPISSEVAKTQLARLAGEVGALTEQDLNRFGGSKDLLSRANQIATTLTSGKMTPESRKQLKQIATEFRTVVQNKIDTEARRQAQSGSALLELPESEVLRIINPESITAKKQTPAGTDSNKAREFIKFKLRDAKVDVKALRDVAAKSGLTNTEIEELFKGR